MLHLRCLWSVEGCETSNQLLPEAEEDRLRIRRAAIQRLSSPDPCPQRILPHRARELETILLVEVRNPRPALLESETGVYRRANLRLLRVLKGKAGVALADVGVPAEIDLGGEATVHNSAIDLLVPGQRLLLFLGASSNLNEACAAMAGTADAVRTMESALSSPH